MLLHFLKNKSVRSYWILSYILVLLIPFLFSFVLYAGTETVLLSEIKAHNQSFLNNKTRMLDDVTAELFKMSNDISHSTRVSDILDYNNHFGHPAALHDTYKLSQDFESLRKSAPYVKNIFLFLHNEDLMITATGIYDLERILSLEFGLPKEKFSEVYTLLKEKQAGEFRSFSQKPDRAIYYVCSDLRGLINDIRFTVLLEVDFHSLLADVMYGSAPNMQRVAVLDRNRTVLAGNLTPEMEAFLLKEEKNVSDAVEKFEQGKYIITHVPSQQNQLSYVYFTLEEQFLDRIHALRWMQVISMLLCMVLGVYVIIVLTRRSYHPIEKLLYYFKEDGGKPPITYNEFDYINHRIKKLSNEKKEYIDRLTRQERFFRRDMLWKLFKGKHSNSPEIETILRSMGVSFAEPCFTVAIFYVENVENIFFENNSDYKFEEELSLSYLVIGNILSELAAEKEYSVFSCEGDGMLHLLFNHRKSASECEKELSEIIAKAKQYIETECNIFFTAGISDTHADIDGISIGYTEAVTSIEQRFFHSEEQIIWFSQLDKSGHPGYYYPLETEQKIVYCLKFGKYEDTMMAIDEVFWHNFTENNQLSTSMAKCLMLDIVCSVIKAQTETRDSFSLESLGVQEFVDEIISCETSLGMINKMKEFLKQASQYFEALHQNVNVDMKEKIDRFLELNYTNPQTDIASLATHFELNQSYLSRRFKEKYEMGLLEYITRFRVEKAKEVLLSDPKITVEQVAEKTGFYSVRTFSRVFTRYVGIAPGRYKENNVNYQEEAENGNEDDE